MLSGVAPSLIPSQVDTKGLRDNQEEGAGPEGGGRGDILKQWQNINQFE